MSSFTVEDLARAALVRILPRSRYRLAAQNDSRFQTFAGHTSRIAYRQQGPTPAFLLFSGPGQDPRAAAVAAAAFAEANWRPTAIQRTVRPGVLVVHVAPAAQLGPAGPVPAAAVPGAVWNVDSDTGRVDAAGSPPGSPPAAELRRAAASLARGVQAPSLGELDLAERNVMQIRTVGMPRALGGVLGIVLFILILRFGLGGLASLLVLPALLGGNLAAAPGTEWIVVAGAALNVLLLAALLLGVAMYFNFRNLALRLPGFSSPAARTRNVTWGAYVAVVVALAVGLQFVIPAAERSAEAGAAGSQRHVTATVADDGGDTYVVAGGDVTVDLSGWPSSEWPGVQFKTSNPSVLTVDSQPAAGGAPVARFSARQEGVSRIDAASSDGRYTFELRVTVFTG